MQCPCCGQEVPGSSSRGRGGGDFAAEFEAAFDRLDRAKGGWNQVELADLRDALAQYSRTEFDAGFKKLRFAQRYVMQPFEGRHERISERMHAASIREGGEVYAFAAKRS